MIQPTGLLISCVLECHVDCVIVMLSYSIFLVRNLHRLQQCIITTQWFELVPHCHISWVIFHYTYM